MVASQPCGSPVCLRRRPRASLRTRRGPARDRGASSQRQEGGRPPPPSEPDWLPPLLPGQRRSRAHRDSRALALAPGPRTVHLDRAPPDKALQLASHSAFQSVHGTVWHGTQALRPSRGGAVARSLAAIRWTARWGPLWNSSSRSSPQYGGSSSPLVSSAPLSKAPLRSCLMRVRRGILGSPRTRARRNGERFSSRSCGTSGVTRMTGRTDESRLSFSPKGVVSPAVSLPAGFAC